MNIVESDKKYTFKKNIIQIDDRNMIRVEKFLKNFPTTEIDDHFISYYNY